MTQLNGPIQILCGVLAVYFLAPSGMNQDVLSRHARDVVDNQAVVTNLTRSENKSSSMEQCAEGTVFYTL